MSRLDVLLESLDDSEVFFLEYSRIRSNRNVVFIIEGKDDPKFYSSKISGIYDLWDLLSVGGKAKVLELRESIRTHPSYKTDNVFFLIDRDFDERILGADIYTTPCYSIENLYCNPSTIRNLIIGECGLSNYKIQNRIEIVNFILQEYKALQELFHRSRNLIAANSIYLYIRTALQPRKINLDKIVKINVRLSDGYVAVKRARKRDYSAIKTTEKNGFRLFWAENAQLKRALESPNIYFRGKQEIMFLKEFVKLLKEDSFLAEKVFLQFGYKLKTDNPAMADHILSSAAQYVHAPECLNDFLRQTRNPKFN